METFDHPFTYLLIGWSGGFASSVVIHFVVKIWSVRHVEDALNP